MNIALLLTPMRLGLLFGLFALGAWLQAIGLLPAIAGFWPDIVYLSQQHMSLVAISGGIAIGIGIPLGILLTRRAFRPYASAVTQVVNIGTTIPTLAILAIAMTIFGPGRLSAMCGLVAHTILPIMLNTVAGVVSVPAPLIEAARGMGMTPWQILIRVELPNALFVIFAGIQTGLVINVGTAPIAFLIGGGGLGELIFTGISLMDPAMLLAGTIPTALLAIFVNFIIGQGQYWLIPRGVNPLR